MTLWRKWGRPMTLFLAVICVVMAVSGCYRAEVESTILTTAAPETVPDVPTTVPEIAEGAPTAPEATVPPVMETTEPAAEPSTIPVTEPETEAPTSEQGQDYVLNNNSRKFHYPTCSSVKQIKESNRSDFHGTREALIAKGYSPCGRCNP